jgi:DNA mismatch endonuclease (patch repair protein)
MPDVFTPEKRSEAMSRICGRGNQDTELALAKLFRQNRITDWQRHLKITLDKSRIVVAKSATQNQRNLNPSRKH